MKFKLIHLEIALGPDCSHGGGVPQTGEVSHLPLVKGEVQNAITWLLSTHINKGLFVPMKLLCVPMSLLQAKL